MRKIYIIGIGPGDRGDMTPRAAEAIAGSEVICGYNVYTDLIKDMCEGKEVITTPMRGEEERCRMAVERAGSGKTTAVVCSGDAGIYGMAGLLIGMTEGKDIELETVPGITAAVSGAAVLGAPLINDFCVISLSDRLTPWEVIEKRLEAALIGDMMTVLYNPVSRTRPDNLRKACGILLRSRKEDTPCGWVRNIGREGQESKILPLGKLADEQLDMFTTVFIGCSKTVIRNGRLVTLRGYGEES